MRLFLKECRKVAFSLTWLIYTVVFVGFVFSQYGEVSKVTAPVPGEASYGEKASGDPELIMPEAIESLFSEYAGNHYVAYPIGFYKNVKLKSADQNRIAEILGELTGQDAARIQEAAGQETVTNQYSAGDGISFSYNGEGGEIIQNADGSFQISVPENGSTAETPTGETPDSDTQDSGTPTEHTDGKPADFSLKPAGTLSYERFQELMDEADQIIGGGSSYNDLYRSSFGKIPVTYEEALERYDKIKDVDHFTGAYARLFSDYAGIVVSILPVFVAVSFGLKDRRNRSLDVIYAKRASSFQIVAARYAALVVMTFLPVLLYAIWEGIRIGVWFPGEATNPFAFLACSFGWLLPSIMISSAVGMVLTELTNTPAAIAVQGIWWFLSTSASMYRMGGGYAWDLIPRHNNLGNTDIFLDNFGQLVKNRLFYTAAALLLAGITVFLYDKKRKGELHGTKIFQKIRRHSQLES